MINTLKLTKYIRQFLLANAELMKIVSNKSIFPIVANANTKYPFITIQRTGVVANYTKDYHSEDIITLEVIGVTNDYSQSIDMATLIRDTLECKQYQDADINIYNIKLDSVQEEYAEEAYIQRLTFIVNAC